MVDVVSCNGRVIDGAANSRCGSGHVIVLDVVVVVVVVVAVLFTVIMVVIVMMLVTIMMGVSIVAMGRSEW
jgi:hypothetical protein